MRFEHLDDFLNQQQHHYMSNACVFSYQTSPQDQIKSLSMVSPRTEGCISDQEVEPNGKEDKGRRSPAPNTCMSSSFSSPRVVTDSTDSSDSGDSRVVARSKDRPNASDAPNASVQLLSRASQSNVNSARKRERDDNESSSSLPVNTYEPSVPQHQQVEDVQSPRFCAMIAERNKDVLLHRLSDTSSGGMLTLINFSRRGLGVNDAYILKQAMQSNPHLSVLKLAYNCLGDKGVAIIASGFIQDDSHHKSLSVLDLGFNCVGDAGCAELALHALARNRTLRTLYLSGNNIQEKGALSLAGAILHGCSVTSLHICANRIGSVGIQALSRALAESEALRHANHNSGGGLAGAMTARDKGLLNTMEVLYLSGISMTAEGFVSIPSMLLTNLSLRVLCLSNNEIDDQGMALLSQALTRNKSVPLEVVELSFNQITCVGVECFMNAVWGSETLRELKLDNNRIADRGAQLAAVVLTSINLELLDLGFNRVTTVGIKALMKSLSENSSLQSLSLSGIPLDPNASKAVSYALAYNSSLRSLVLDSCQVGYSAQRHIVAGIVSNRNASIRLLHGFEIGAISVTLGLPQVLETWCNDQVLSFIRLMWETWRQGQREPWAGSAGIPTGTKRLDAAETGPAPPTTVVAAAKKALTIIGEDGGAWLRTEPHERQITEMSPFVPANATLLERTDSGTVRVPSMINASDDVIPEIVEAWTESGSDANGGGSHFLPTEPKCDPVRKKLNLEWLRTHFRSLNEVARLPFNNADLWQLHQHFFSPVIAPSENRETAGSPLTSDAGSSHERTEQSDETTIVASKKYTYPKRRSRTPQCSPLPIDASKKASLGRTISFQMLGEAVAAADVTSLSSCLNKRRSWFVLEEEQTETPSEDFEPASKRAKSFKPRIAYYPRIREKLETLGAKPSQEQTLSLLRRLKFVESVMFQGSDAYADVRDPEHPSSSDVEMIILDLL